MTPALPADRPRHPPADGMAFARLCRVCLRPMHSYGLLTWGVHIACRPVGQPRGRACDRWVDDHPEVIEAKFQAARHELRRDNRLRLDIGWPSSLLRQTR
jgi:hypothetical protein